MKKGWLILFPVAILFYFMFSSDSSSAEYVLEINQFWEDRHDFFVTSQASPFVQKNQPYEKVPYFEPNPDYKVTGVLDRFNERSTLVLGNSDGTSTTYLKFGMVNFKIEGKPCSLLLLKALGFGNQYLLAFGDDTSGDTTYGGGRYLDVVVGKSNEIILDFNKAYNPYCAYFDDFTCPLPPAENLLEVAINAGEKSI